MKYSKESFVQIWSNGKHTVESDVFREDNGEHDNSGSGGGVSGGVVLELIIPSFINFRDGSSLKFKKKNYFFIKFFLSKQLFVYLA